MGGRVGDLLGKTVCGFRFRGASSGFTSRAFVVTGVWGSIHSKL